MFFSVKAGFAEDRRFYVTPRMEGVDLTSYTSFYVDQESQLSFAEVKLKYVKKEFLPLPKKNLGFLNGVIWTRLEIMNNSSNVVRWFLEFDYPMFDNIQVFSSDSGDAAIHQAGDRFPFADRPVDYRNPSFPMKEPPHSRRIVYLRLQNEGTVNVSLYAHTTKHFFNKINNEQLLLGLYYGIVLVMFFYNLFIYISTREKSYLYYALFVFLYGSFQFTVNGFSFQYLWPSNTSLANYVLPFQVSFATLIGIQFTYAFLRIPEISTIIPKIMRSLQMAAVAIMILAVSQSSYRYLLYSCMLLGILFISIAYFSGVKGFLLGQRSARFFIAAWTIFLTGIAMYILQSLGIIPDIFITRWSIQIGSGLEMALLSFALADRINDLRNEVQIKNSSLVDAQTQIAQNEKLTAQILRASPDIIFTFSEELVIKTANPALYSTLGYKQSDVTGKKLYEIFFSENEARNTFLKLYLKERMKELASSSTVIEMSVRFRHKFLGEPKYMKLLLHRAIEQSLIIGIAIPATEDLLSRFVEREHVLFKVNNYIKNAESLSERLTRSLARRVDRQTQESIRNSLKEILINAIEHGNLGITYEEKTALLDKKQYFIYLQEKQKEAEEIGKKVEVEYILHDTHVEYTISDEGEGFEFNRYLNKEMNANNSLHGRGIFMANMTFDSIEYSAKGNSVTLIKKFAKN